MQLYNPSFAGAELEKEIYQKTSSKNSTTSHRLLKRQSSGSCKAPQYKFQVRRPTNYCSYVHWREGFCHQTGDCNSILDLLSNLSRTILSLTHLAATHSLDRGEYSPKCLTCVIRAISPEEFANMSPYEMAQRRTYAQADSGFHNMSWEMKCTSCGSHCTNPIYV